MLSELTSREDHPYKVHEEIIAPKVQEFRSTICDAFIVVVEHTRSIVEDKAVYLTDGDNYLQGMAQWMVYDNKSRHNKAQRAPGKLA
jgi:hypothetical protein